MKRRGGDFGSMMNEVFSFQFSVSSTLKFLLRMIRLPIRVIRLVLGSPSLHGSGFRCGAVPVLWRTVPQGLWPEPQTCPARSAALPSSVHPPVPGIANAASPSSFGGQARIRFRID